MINYIAKRHKKYINNRPVIYNVTTSKVVSDIAKKHGLKAIMCKTGHSYIRDEMEKRNAFIAGESSGHIFINKPFYYGFDDALFNALFLIKIINDERKSLNELINELPKYITSPTYQIYCPDNKKYEKINEITNMIVKMGLKPITINGARVEFDDGWFIIRASSNMPSIVVRIEAKTKKRIGEIKMLVKTLLNKAGIKESWKTG